MRPLRIEIEGLRSFRTKRTIDFSDLGLVAIVGDTGAGKSSILEAMTYALYNGSTWDQRNARALISDGTNTMRVELDFSAEGEQWRVVRATSRTNYPPSIHKLQCLSDLARTPFDGESAVGAEIRRLVGLEHEGFCSAVVLPQGRFQELLQRSRGARTAILKSIFRLDQLSEVRHVASGRLNELRPTLEGLRARREVLEDDPKAAAKVAEKDRKACAALGKELDSARKKHADLLKKTAIVSERETRLASYATELADCPRPAEALQLLVSQLTSFSDRAEELDSKQRGLRSTQAEYQSLVSKAEACGESKAMLEATAERLRSWGAGVAQLVEDEADAAATAERLRDEEADLASAEPKRSQLASASKVANRARDEARSANVAASARLSAGKTALGAYESALGESARVAEAAEDHQAALHTAEEDVSSAALVAEAARNARDRQREALEAIQRTHAAAHAAVGLVVGDPCPICERELPSGFHPPELVGGDAAQAALTEAESKLDEADAALNQAKGTLKTAKTAAKLDAGFRQVADKKLAEAKSSVIEVLGELDLSRPSAEPLRELEEAADSAAEGFEAADRAAGDRERELAVFDAGVKPRKQALEQEQARLVRRRSELSKGATSLEETRGKIPKRFRPPRSATDLGSYESSLKDASKEAASWEQAITDAGSKIEELAKAHRVIQLERAKLDRPIQKAHDDLTEALRTLEGGDRLLGYESEAAPQMGTPSEDAAAAILLDGRRERIEARLERERAATHKEITKIENDVGTILADHGASDAKHLEKLHMNAHGEEREHQVRVDTLTKQVPVAAELDRRIEPLSDLESALDALCSQLTDARFIAFAVERRQKALLATATEILGRMTGDRYGFAENFDIIDRLSGQPRSTKTLSGGETFLASLALALGLVEMAGRSGGRLEALFLDEGFGALDADALDDALGELERRASTGRLVGVISHVGAVAERIETVLRVDRSPEGSDVHIVDQSGRWDIVERDLGGGLLA